jgi:hypothetical protein
LNKRKGAYRVLVGKSIGYRPLAKTQLMDIKRNWFGRRGEKFDLAQDRNTWCAVVSTGMRLRVP